MLFRSGDYTEEYQAYYHEELIKQLYTRKYMWATHVWNMFDFGADSRNEGGENGQNHKGLITFDRKYKKDSFYAYKAWLSDEPFVLEICRHAMTADFIDPMVYLSMYVGSTTPGNTVDDAKYEELVAAANAIDDKTERMNALHAAENYLVGEQHYVIPLFGYAEPYLMSSKVTGVTHSPEGHYQLAYAKVEK